MKTSEVLRRVLTHLGDENYTRTHQRYICFALHQLYALGMIGDLDRTRCKRLIRVHLGDAHTLEHWLLEHHGVRPQCTRAYIRKIMVTRKAWVTHLIEHYETKGD
jgi:hypothetical protein